jgi:hypothetical protein
MNGGSKAGLLISFIALGGCATATNPVKVRAIADPSAAISRGGDSILVARGQLMLGNVGLALEEFRKAQRVNPSDTAALAGIGDCYAAMGRFDLAQSNYETALASAPHDRKLLLGLAAIFESQGKLASAAAARAEAGIVREAAATQAIAQKQALASLPIKERQFEVPAPAIGSVTVGLPAARPAENLESRQVILPEPQIAEDMPLKSTVTVQLPPARPASPRLPIPRDNEAPTAAVVLPPRLERLSSGEVALVTTTKPIWRSSKEVQTASGSTVRWVALADPGRPNVQILNAARTQGLAASARTVLVGRGWRKIEVADAPMPQRKSVVLYPKNRAILGRRLAAQFGVTAEMADRDDVILVLGRDAVDRITGQKRS